MISASPAEFAGNAMEETHDDNFDLPLGQYHRALLEHGSVANWMLVVAKNMGPASW